MNKTNVIVKNTAVIFAARIIVSFLSFAAIFFIARRFGVEDYGKYALALSFVALFAPLGDLGVDMFLTREVAKDKSSLKSILGNVLAMKLILAGVLFGLVFSALSSLSMGVVNQLSVFYLLAIGVGFLSRIGGPARQAMIADLLPEEQRAEGFSILRVAVNVSWVLGPSIGGFLAARSYMLLFVLDAITSLITAVIVYRSIPETKPAAPEGKPQQSVLETLAGYRLVVRDTLYMAFLFTSILMLIVYQQLYSTLSVYLRDVHGIPAQGEPFSG